MAGYGYKNTGYGGNEKATDDEGRKRLIISNGPNHYSSESFVTAIAQRIVENVHPPVVVASYTYRTHCTVEPLVEDYVLNTRYRTHEIDADDDQSWRPRNSSPVHDRPQVVVIPEYGYNVPIKPEPVKNYGVSIVRDGDRFQVKVPGYWCSSSPTKREPLKRYDATNDNKYGRPSSPVLDRPQVVVPNSEHCSPAKPEPSMDFGAQKAQTVVSQPTRPQFLTAAWRKPPDPTAPRGGGATAYDIPLVYRKTITSDEAARKYNGVKVT